MVSYRSHVVSGLFDQTENVCFPGMALRSPVATSLLNWWWQESKNGIPPKSCFDILEHFDAAPDLFLIEVLPNRAFRTRLIGERAKSYVEEGRLGYIICKDDPKDFLAVLWRHYSKVVEKKLPVLCTGHVSYTAQQSQLYEGLDCPLTTNGHTVTYIIGIIKIF